MNLTYANSALEAQINEIKKKIRLLMNGMTADSMKSKGLVYKQNFGVSLSHLQLLAGRYPKSSDLAKRLWNQDIRETMILATMLQPTAEFTEEEAFSWLSRCHNTELREQACMNLYRHVPFAPDFCTKCILSDEREQQIFGFMLARRIYMNFSAEEADLLIEKGFAMSDSGDMQLSVQIGSCLSGFCRRDRSTAEKINKLLKETTINKSAGSVYIVQTVRQELLFLNIITEDF